MMKRLGGLALAVSAAAVMAVVVPRALGATGESANLIVHEWGTFTSIAGADGQAVSWRPLTGPSELPCFVTALNPNSIKIPVAGSGLGGLTATVRMETPVVYFYSPSEQTAQVSVTFPSGIISEWYPQAAVPAVAPVPSMVSSLGRIHWADVKVMPGAPETFPTDPDGSHYYTARETDAAPLRVGGQAEKFLFYRGLASFPLPLSATIDRDGRIAVEQRGANPIDTFVLFEKRNGRLGYRVAHAGGSRLVINRPELTGTMESLRGELREMLVGQGLFAREATAMVDTWRDSWFEDGARLFYLLPQAAVDAILQLEISPTPLSVKRVFVGRLELVTPEIETEVANALRTNDQPVLRKYGRFLEPISQMVRARLAAIHDAPQIDAALKTVSSSQPGRAACAPASKASATGRPSNQ